MSLGRLLMLFGLILLPVGLIYGMSTMSSNSKAAMFTELACLAVGALIFFLGFNLEKRAR
jgi:hypothetical protein